MDTMFFNDSSKIIGVTASSVKHTLPGDKTSYISIINKNSFDVFATLGANNVPDANTSTSTVIPANSCFVWRKKPEQTHISVIGSVGNIYVQCGSGV